MDHLQPNQHCRLVGSRLYDHEWLNAAGKYHRVDENGIQDGPALIFHKALQVWYHNGKRNRLDGPAQVWRDGRQEWWLDGVRMTPEEWYSDPRVLAYHSRTQQGAEEWLRQL